MPCCSQRKLIAVQGDNSNSVACTPPQTRLPSGPRRTRRRAAASLVAARHLAACSCGQSDMIVCAILRARHAWLSRAVRGPFLPSMQAGSLARTPRSGTGACSALGYQVPGLAMHANPSRVQERQVCKRGSDAHDGARLPGPAMHAIWHAGSTASWKQGSGERATVLQVLLPRVPVCATAKAADTATT